jgi:hypothetical protein
LIAGLSLLKGLLLSIHLSEAHAASKIKLADELSEETEDTDQQTMYAQAEMSPSHLR